MSTRTPLQHGERRCYLRGCRRPECSNAHYRYMSRYRLDTERGNNRRVPSGPVAAHVRQLIADGWSHGQIAAAARCTSGAISRVSRHRYPTIATDLAARILAARPTVSIVEERTSVSAVGTIRRVQALIAIGHSLLSIAEASGITKTALGHIVNHSHETITARNARSVANVYADWSEQPGTFARSRNRARDLGWPPPAAWDDDTIDDPTALPEWTGYCGTDRGWWMHRQQDIPVCNGCETAHEQWKQEHRHLPRSEYMAALATSRASASRRGAVIAQNGRELLADGATYEHAAERLGVSTQHLFQELRRHPATAEELETAA